jgi:AcrR family transcriptional regulator
MAMTAIVAPVRARRRLSPSARRAQVLDAAARAFASAGYAGTSITAVAHAAEVTPRILYRHFASKAELYEAMLERVAARLTVAFAAPTGRYGVDVAELLHTARADTDGFRVLWRHAAREPEFRAVADRCRAAAVACARAGLAAWTPHDALDWAAPAVVGYELEAILTWIEFGHPADDARFVRATRASLAAGVRAWAAD